jgi:hypothetical protein
MSKIIDQHYETTFKKYDPNGTEKIKQVDFYYIFNELVQIYNQAIEEGGNGSGEGGEKDKKDIDKKELTEEEKDKITVESLMN